VAIERQYPTHEASLDSDASWDSLESQIDGIEQEALFDVAAAAGAATGALGTITVSGVSGSAVELTPRAERRERLAESSLDSDASWDSLESQIDGIETEALFLGRVDASAVGEIGTVTVSAIEGAATGGTLAADTGNAGERPEWWYAPAAKWILDQDDEIIILRRKTSSRVGV
jgi:hypothetical protein